MNETKSRRSFFGKAALAGGAVISGSGKVMAKSKNTPSVELMKIGVIAVGEHSHMNSKGSIWAPAINPTEPERWPMRTSRMLITHCWDSKPDIAEEFVKRYHCETVKNYYDMVDKVDAMIFAGFYETEWWPQLTKPYLEAGIPCFINRPFAYCMKDAHTMIERAKKHNTPILCTDAHEDVKEGLYAASRVKDILKEGKTIFGVSSTNSAGEYPAHGIHGLYLLLPILGLDVEQVSLQAPGWWIDKVLTSPKTMDWGLLSLQYRGIKIDGIGEQKKPFLAAQQMLRGSPFRATIRLYHSDGCENFDHRSITDDIVNLRYHFQGKTVFDMQRMFETRKMPWSYDYILKKTKIFLAGFKSHLEHNGAMIRVDDLPEDWKAPNPRPDWIDENIFK